MTGRTGVYYQWRGLIMPSGWPLLTEGEEGQWARQRKKHNRATADWTRNRNPKLRPDVQLAHFTSPLAWRPGGWSSIPNLLPIFKLFKVDYMLDDMHVGFMELVIYIVVIWIWIGSGETWIELLGFLIETFEASFGEVMWGGSPELCICILWLCMRLFRVVYAEFSTLLYQYESEYTWYWLQSLIYELEYGNVWFDFRTLINERE